MGIQEALSQNRIKNRLVKAHKYLTSAARLAEDEDDHALTLDDVERLKHLAEQVELALADLCDLVVVEELCI